MRHSKLTITLSSLLFLVHASFSQSLNYQKQLITLKRVIEREHYSPRPVDDQFSAELFDRLIDRLDEDKLIFVADDLKQLSAYRLILDDELNGLQWSFLDKLLPLYKSRLKRADSIVIQILQKPFDLNQSETFVVDTTQFPANDQQLKAKWQKWLKYETITRLEEDCRTLNSDPKKCLESEPAARAKAKISAERNITKVLEHPSGYENYVISMYCDLIASSFDPHTEYMPPTSKELFVSSLNPEGYYFGLSIIENDKRQIELAKLMPGSPAWNCGELNQGDIFLQLQWEGKAPIDLDGASAEEVSEILDNSNERKMEFTVKKQDGMIKKVSLTKEKIRNDDNNVKGFVLKGATKIGYIYLPGFYTDFEQTLPTSCANDVAKEVVKLLKENIQGLIIDVRYNGGGSLQEALDMAGIFIDQGPLSLLKDRTGKLVTLKDMNRGTIYDGPLLLLVNGQSASASELLAAALQDYHRAIILGGNTFGKGTAQIILPVDTSRSGAGSSITDSDPQYGFVKVTVNKFYRVSGGTTQHIGVKPDIVVPDIFDGLDYRESAAFHSLPADQVKKNSYYQPLPALPIADLKTKSDARTRDNAAFAEVKKFADLLQQDRKSQPTSISLKWTDYVQASKKMPAPNMDMEKIEHPSSIYAAENISVEKDRLKNDAYLRDINAEWLKRVMNDIYIQEAFNVMNDYINLITHKTN